jgi:hypothetical protein
VRIAFWNVDGDVRLCGTALVNAFDDGVELHQTDGDLIPALELRECEADIWRVMRQQRALYREAA